jgi:flagellar motility protein MotE (MotC chaperone)
MGMGSARRSRRVAAAVACGLAGSTIAYAAETAPGAPKPPAPKAQAAAPAAPPATTSAQQTTPAKPASLAEQYCRAIRDSAAEARFAAQVAKLENLGKELDKRLEQIEARTAELKTWFAKREEFSQRATGQLVSIYAAMRPESASEQLTRMDEITAAAILSKLEPRAASAVLNDMPAEKAARLASILAGASRKADSGDRS